MSPERAAYFASCPEDAFLAGLAATGGRAIGHPRAVSSRSVQPLALRVRESRVADRQVYIGNAAQALHPVAGQGLNLGLRDAWDLAQILRGARDPGDARLLRRFAFERSLDASSLVRVTDFLAGAFVGSSRAARAARGIGLALMDVLPGPRRFFARRMVFGASALP